MSADYQAYVGAIKFGRVEPAPRKPDNRAMTAAAPASSPPLVARRDDDGVALLTLDRPTARNALSLAMIEALSAAFSTIGTDARVRAVVLSAAGPVFSSGHDLKELTAARAGADKGRAFFDLTMRACAAMMQQIVALPQPVIAAVEGTATAAGCQLVATCDLAVAGADARFCTPGVNIGLFCSTPMVALTRNLARKHAMEMLLLGDLVPADEAHRMGLINRVTPAGGALAEALALARRIAARSKLTVKTGKRAFYAQAEMGLADAYDHAAHVMVENMLAADAEEGIGAFIEKRTPQWKDR
jgi:enoyl-CoA hydratase/carnithine racemase